MFALNLDVHYDAGGEAYLCHGLCALGRRRAADALAELAAFVARERGVVVQIALESYVAPADAAALLNAPALAPYLHAQSEGAPWPTPPRSSPQRARRGARQLCRRAGRVRERVARRRGARVAASVLSLRRRDAVRVLGRERLWLRGRPRALDSGAAFRPLYVVNHFLTDPVPNPVLAKRANRREPRGARGARASRSRPRPHGSTLRSVGSVVDVVGELHRVGSAPSRPLLRAQYTPPTLQHGNLALRTSEN